VTETIEISRPTYLGTNAEDRTKPKFSFSVIIRMYNGVETIEVKKGSPEAANAEEAKIEPKPIEKTAKSDKKVDSDDEEMDRMFGKMPGKALNPEIPVASMAAKDPKLGRIVRTAFFVTVVRNPKFSPDIHIHPWLFNTFKPLEDQTRIE